TRRGLRVGVEIGVVGNPVGLLRLHFLSQALLRFQGLARTVRIRAGRGDLLLRRRQQLFGLLQLRRQRRELFLHRREPRLNLPVHALTRQAGLGILQRRQLLLQILHGLPCLGLGLFERAG